MEIESFRGELAKWLADAELDIRADVDAGLVESITSARANGAALQPRTPYWRTVQNARKLDNMAGLLADDAPAKRRRRKVAPVEPEPDAPDAPDAMDQWFSARASEEKRSARRKVQLGVQVQRDRALAETTRELDREYARTEVGKAVHAATRARALLAEVNAHIWIGLETACGRDLGRATPLPGVNLRHVAHCPDCLTLRDPAPGTDYDRMHSPGSMVARP